MKPQAKMGDKLNLLVELLLLCRHINTEDLLHLGRKRFFYVFFDTPQEERFKDFVKTVITIIPSLPVVVLKILPRIKPVCRVNRHHL